MELHLPDEHRPGRVQPLDDRGVLTRYAIGQETGPSRRPDASRVDVVLERHREAVQGAQQLAAGERLVGASRPLTCEVGGDRHKDPQLGVEPLDPLQALLRQLGGGELARAQAIHDPGHGHPPSPAVSAGSCSRNVRAMSTRRMKIDVVVSLRPVDEAGERVGTGGLAAETGMEPDRHHSRDVVAVGP